MDFSTRSTVSDFSGESGDSLSTPSSSTRRYGNGNGRTTTTGLRGDDYESPSPSQQSSKGSIQIHKPTPRYTNRGSLDELTVNKLLYSSLRLYGRDKETAILKKCLARTMDQKLRQLVLISGYSGTGKSALAATLERQVQKAHGFYARGKFDLYMRNEPYAGIVSACGELFGSILFLKTQDATKFEAICAKLVGELGEELVLLTTVIPLLQEFIGNVIVKHEEGRQDSVEAKNRLNFAFRRFFRAITSFFQPLVLVLDDLQWADGSSLDLVQVLLSDRENPHLMVVGMFRSNEVNESHLLTRTIRDLRTRSDDDNFDMTEMEVGNLDFTAVHQLLQDLLSIEDSRSLSLAEICHKKTQGNVFFLLHFLSLLKEKHLLEYSLGAMKWTWKDEEIENGTRATDNVVDMLKDKMEDLSDEESRDVLRLAACLGSTFDEHVLSLVWMESRKPSQRDADHHTLSSCLSAFEVDGFIESYGDESYRWIHDKIQEAAMMLVPSDERSTFNRHVGQILVAKLSEEELDATIFVVVNLLNEDGIPPVLTKRLELARLNLQAGRKAVSFSAFESAAQYIKRGVECLPVEDRWTTHYELYLALYASAAQTEGYLGDIDAMEAYCNEVLSLEDRPLQDKFQFYNTLLDGINTNERAVEALDISLDVLKQCKCRLPRREPAITLQILLNIAKIKATMGSRNPAEISNMELMKDPMKIEIMRLLDKATSYAYITDDGLLPLIAFRSFQYTLKYGLSIYSPASFAVIGLILTGVLGDFQGGTAYGKYALLLMEKVECRMINSRSLFIAHSFVLHWTMLAQHMLKPLLSAYEVGMQTGDSESAMWAIFHYCVISFRIGTSLHSVEADGRIYASQMSDLKREKQSKLTRLLWQVVLNLMGRSENPLVLTGEAMVENDDYYGERGNKEAVFAVIILRHWQRTLFTFFGEYERCAESALEHLVMS